MEKTGFFSQFTDEQMKAQYRANLVSLQQMYDRAKKTGKKVNGFTVDALALLVDRYKKLSE